MGLKKLIFMVLVIVPIMVSLAPAHAKKVHVDKQAREAAIDANIVGMMHDFPAWKKYEKAALNREVVIGMHQVLFDAIRNSWNCEENETKLPNDRYHTQYVCTAAFSKHPKELQGKYFYTDGRIVRTKTGQFNDGTVTVIQGQ